MWCCMNVRKVKKCSPRRYVVKITFKARNEELNIVVIGKTSCREPVPPSSSWEEAVQMEVPSY